MAVIVCFAVVATTDLIAGTVASAAPEGAIRYLYDDAGRLKAVSDPSSESAVYGWDVVGNLLSLARHASSSVQIFQVSPGRGPVGATVRLYGTGFGSTASQNTLRFNGTVATISSASATELVATVPGGATSGAVTVTAPGGSAASDGAFTVTSAPGPTISGISPAVAAPGDSVTISGSGFEPGVDSWVTLNNSRAEVVSASATSIGITVPPATGSAPVRLWTPDGATNGPDLFVPPAGFIPGDVQTTARMQVGETKNVSTTTSGKIALVVFEGSRGQQLSLEQISSSYSGYCFSLLKPDNTTLANNCNGFLDAVTLPSDGSYTVLVDPTGSATGSLTFKLHDASDAHDTIAPSASGDTKSLTTTVPGQNGRLTFSGSAGQRVSVKVASTTYPYSAGWAQLSILKPDGSTLAAPINACCAGIFLDTVTLPSAGTYTILVDPRDRTTGSMSLTAHDVPADASYTATPSSAGDTKTVTTTVPGQNGKVTFNGTAGQRIAIRNSPQSYTPASSAYMSIRKPDGSTLGSPSDTWIDTATLPATGSYTISVDPTGAGVGSSTLTVWDVPADVSGSLTPNSAGASSTVTTTVPGQNGKVTFSGTAGQRIFVYVDSSTIGSSTSMWLRKPDGSALDFTNVASAGSFFNMATLPVSGTYTIYVDPSYTNTGSLGLTVYDVPPDSLSSVTPSTSGGQANATTTVPGQDSRIAFDGTAGQRISFNMTAKSFADWAYISVLKPDGTTFTNVGNVSSVPYFVDTLTLPTAGTYKILVDPYSKATGNVAMTVYDVPADAADTIAFSATGDAKTLSTSVPGQNGKLTFNASQGQKASLRVTSLGYSAAQVSLKNPDGSSLISPTYLTGPYTFSTVTLPATGTYTIVVDPYKSATGSLTLGLTDVSSSSFAPMSAAAASRRGLPAGETASPLQGGERIRATRVERPHGIDQGSTFARRRMALLGYRAWMPQFVSQLEFGSPTRREIALRPPGVPQLELRIPAGTVVRDSAGDRLHRLDLERISAAQAPSPLPHGVDGALFLSFSTTARLSKSVLLLYPNASHARPRQRLYLWSYDARSERWFVYGRGTVTADGKQVLPDPNDELSVLTATATSTSRPARRKRPASRSQERARLAPRAGDARSVRQPDPTRRRTNARQRRRGSTLAPGSSPEPSKATQLRARFKPQGSTIWRPRERDRNGSWLTRRPHSPWESLPALRAREGTTALAGQALKLDGQPLPGVSVGIEHSDAATRTDRSGRFLLTGLTPGHHVLVVDGDSGQRYGEYEIGVDTARGRTTELDAPIWMTALDPAGDTKLASPSKEETVLRTPRIPGLEVRIPAGSVIRGRDGQIVRKLNLTQVPVDRPPFALPKFIHVPTYFTLQPGGAYLSKGAQIVYPNYNHLPAGQRVDFWQYDPDDRGWHVYGRGTVTADGEQVMPDSDVRIWEFTGAMISGSPNPPGAGPPAGGGPSGGDPVDLATGLFVYEKTDLFLPDVLPIELRRTYRQGDPNSYAFGVGANHSYDMRLWSVNNYQDVSLILPDGGRVFYVRTSPGTSYTDAVYEAQTTPGRFYKSTISQHSGQWDLRLRDGTVYVFPWYGPLKEIRDRFGNRLVIARDGAQKITRITSPGGRWVAFSYDGSNRITEARDNGGRTARYSYDASGRLATATDVAGGVTTYSYNAAHQMTAIQDPRGITYLQNSYDANGRVGQQTLANGGTYQFAYTVDGSGKVTKTRVTDPVGRIEEHGFNSAGYATSVKRGVGTSLEQQTSFERQPGTNLPLSMTDPLNRKTSYQYDSTGNLTQVTQQADSPDAVSTSYSYEPSFSQLTTVTDPLQHTTNLGYDGRGQLTSIQDPSGRETTLAYAGNDGLATKITDPAGKSTKLGYDHGDLASTEDPLGNRTSYITDPLGRLRSVTNPLGQRTRYDYNAHNQVTKITDPQGSQTTFAYNPNGGLTDVTDARGSHTSATYNSLDLIASWSDGLARTENYSYDQAGELTQFTDRKGQIRTYRYDALGRRSFAGFGTTGSPPAEAFDSTIDYHYDAADRITEAIDSVNGSQLQTYDGLDRLTSQTGPQGTVSYTYDAAGRRSSMTAPSQSALTYSYDNANRLTALSRSGQTVTLAHDQAGRRSSTTLPNGIAQQYTYDDASRLTAINYKLGQATLGELNYEYDPAGRRTATWGSYARTGLPTPLSSASYDAANQRTTQDGTALSYDQNGNLTADGQNTYSWNKRNQLASTSGPSGTASFTYDPYGRRQRKTINGQTTDYLYDRQNVVQERSGGTPTANLLTGLGLDELFARTTSTGGTSSYLQDALGSTLALTDAFGVPTTTYTYDPFGNTSNAGSNSDNPYQYTGRENDGTGLYYYRARYYSPTRQRFLSEDPSGLQGGDINLYGYALNAPTRWTDRTGRTVFDDLGHAASDAGNWVGGAAEDTGEWVLEHPTEIRYGLAGGACVASGGLGCGAAVAVATGGDLFDQAQAGELTFESGATTVAFGAIGGAARFPAYVAGARSGGGAAGWAAVNNVFRAQTAGGYAARGAITWPGIALNISLAGRKVGFGGFGD